MELTPCFQTLTGLIWSGLWICNQGLAHLGGAFGWASPQDAHIRNHIVSFYCLTLFTDCLLTFLKTCGFFLSYSSVVSVLDVL